MKNYIHKIQYYETDKMGITHHSNYIRWMEEARSDYLEQINMGMDKLEKIDITSPILSVNCNYKHGTTFGDSVEIETKIKEYNGIKIKIEYVLKNNMTKQIVATGETESCFISVKTGRPLILKKVNPELDEKFKELYKKQFD